jgi:hypothetical protein
MANVPHGGMSAVRWEIEFSGATAFVAGPKNEARRRLYGAGDRSPIWTARRKAWATSPEAARGVLDQLDARRIPYRVEDAAQAGLDLHVDLTLDFNAPEPEPERPRWQGITYGARSW